MEFDQKAAKLIKKNGYAIGSFLAKKVLNKEVNLGRFGGLLSPIKIKYSKDKLIGEHRRTEKLNDQYNQRYYLY